MRAQRRKTLYHVCEKVVRVLLPFGEMEMCVPSRYRFVLVKNIFKHVNIMYPIKINSIINSKTNQENVEIFEQKFYF